MTTKLGASSVLAAVAVCVTACGQVQARTPSGALASNVSPSVSMVSPSPSPGVEPRPDVTDQRLVSLFTYEGGNMQFDAVPQGFIPNITASQAYQDFANSDAVTYSPQLMSATPEVFLAAYTSFGSGPGVGTDPTVAGYDHLPVWAIRFTNVLGAPSGPGNPSGSTVSHNDQLVRQDVLVIVDAKSGKLLLLLDALPDLQPQATPRL